MQNIKLKSEDETLKVKAKCSKSNKRGTRVREWGQKSQVASNNPTMMQKLSIMRLLKRHDFQGIKNPQR